MALTLVLAMGTGGSAWADDAEVPDPREAPVGVEGGSAAEPAPAPAPATGPGAPGEAPPSSSYRMDSDVLPSLGDRQIGEPATRDGETYEWPHRLPFFAQDVIDKGFDLPNPYGAGAIFYMQNQDAIVSDLTVSFNGGDDIPIDFLQFGTAKVENITPQMKLDAWLFPFFNVYVTGGYVNGSVEVPLQIDGTALIDAILPPLLNCSGPLPPDLCGKTFGTIIKPGYQGGNITTGGILAVGWRQFFALANFAYTWSWIDIVDTTVNAIYFSPRGGITGDMGNLGSVQAYVGAGFLVTDVRMNGAIQVDLGGPGTPDINEIGFSIRQKNKDRWNFIVGANWDVKRWLSIQAELGFGGSRSNIIVSSTYRF